MNLSSELQQEVEKWAKAQGISTEQFIGQAISEKVKALEEKMAQLSLSRLAIVEDSLSEQLPRLYRKQGILIVESKPVEDFDFNRFIDELREQRIQEQFGL